MAVIESLHRNLVFARRVRVLTERLSDLLPKDATVLDVGSGNGLIAHMIGQRRPDVTLTGIDVLVRPKTYIPVEAFDGYTLPCEDRSVGIVMFIDVLHHTDDPERLLREATRVAKDGVVIKDHLLEGFLAGPTLRFMDWVGNAQHGVSLPFRFWPRQRWGDTIHRLGLNTAHWQDQLGLYPWPASWFFDRSLHFIARLDHA